MSLVLVTEQHLIDTADSIRAKLGVQTTYKPREFAAAIDSIQIGGTIPDSKTGVYTLAANAQTMQIPHGLGKIPAMACFYPEENAINTSDWGITVGGTFCKVKADGSNLFPFTPTSGWSADRAIPNRVGLYCTDGVDIFNNVRMIYLYDDDDWGIIDVDNTYIYIKAGYASNPWLWNGISYRWWVIGY